MTYAYLDQPGRGLFFSGLFAESLQKKTDISQRRMVSDSIRALERLSDRQLEDIGIPRAELRWRAERNVYHGDA